MEIEIAEKTLYNISLLEFLHFNLLEFIHSSYFIVIFWDIIVSGKFSLQ